jgi:hypothetical protein
VRVRDANVLQTTRQHCRRLWCWRCWQWNVIPVIALPGLSNPHPGLTLKERITRSRSTDPLPGTCVVRIDITDREH